MQCTNRVARDHCGTADPKIIRDGFIAPFRESVLAAR